jgi:hydroxyquinol 1,2-dioxygenase
VLTDEVREAFGDCETPRHTTVLQALVTHLHAFAREVALTEAEWFAAIDFLTRAGQACTPERQELVLLSDVLGLSMLVVGLHDADEATPATESTVFGPFYVPGAPVLENGGDLAAGAPGDPCAVSGRVLDVTGAPVVGAIVDVWQADAAGLYDVQYPDLEAPRARGRLVTDADGRFWFRTIMPEPYPIPTDGPVGELLAASRRSSMRPAHIHFMVVADGFERLITHVFVAGDPYLATDAVFGVRSSLIAPFVDGADGDEGRSVRYDLVLRRSPG